MFRAIAGKIEIWLPDVGWCEAKMAEHFQPGEYLQWPGGETTRVKRIEVESSHIVTVIEDCVRDGEVVENGRRLLKKRYLGIGEENAFLETLATLKPGAKG